MSRERDFLRRGFIPPITYALLRCYDTRAMSLFRRRLRLITPRLLR